MAARLPGLLQRTVKVVHAWSQIPIGRKAMWDSRAGKVVYSRDCSRIYDCCSSWSCWKLRLGCSGRGSFLNFDGCCVSTTGKYSPTLSKTRLCSREPYQAVLRSIYSDILASSELLPDIDIACIELILSDTGSHSYVTSSLHHAPSFSSQ